jgi:hypothetical protein
MGPRLADPSAAGRRPLGADFTIAAVEAPAVKPTPTPMKARPAGCTVADWRTAVQSLTSASVVTQVIPAVLVVKKLSKIWER